jgi:hypothetical protein
MSIIHRKNYATILFPMLYMQIMNLLLCFEKKQPICHITSVLQYFLISTSSEKHYKFPRRWW